MSKFINIIFLRKMIEVLLLSLSYFISVLVAYLRGVFADFRLPDPLPESAFLRLNLNLKDIF